jgi:hypothetical protein
MTTETLLPGPTIKRKRKPTLLDEKVPQTIRVDPDVWQALSERAEGFENANRTLRRLLGLPKKPLRKVRE